MATRSRAGDDEGRATVVKRLQDLHTEQQEPLSTQLQQLKLWDARLLSDPTPHHALFRAEFRRVNVHNKHWFEARYRYALNDWRTKMMFSILTSAVVNSWVLYEESDKMSLVAFRRGIISLLE